MSKIAVVGAGIAGLACAYELTKAGHTVTVYESEPDVGGRMRHREKDGLKFDIGATHLIPNYTHMLEYVDELGLEWMPMDFCTYGLFRDGEIKPIHKALTMKGTLALANAYRKVGEGSDFRDLETIVKEDTDNAYDYAVKEFGQEIADYIVDPFTAAYQFHRATEVSKATLIAVLESVKASKTKWDLHRIKGGMSVLPQALADKVDTVHTNTEVTKVENTDDGVVIHSARGEEQFDYAVVSTIAPSADWIITNPTPGQKDVISNTEYAKSVSIAFTVDADSLPQTSITWVPYVENTKFSGISNEVMKGDDLRNNGKQLLCTWMHDGWAREMIDKSDEEIWEAVMEEFPKICPWITKEDLQPHDLQKWEAAMPKFAHGHLTRVHNYLESGEQGSNRVWLCGDYLNSPWTEGALWNGKRVAQDVVEKIK